MRTIVCVALATVFCAIPLWAMETSSGNILRKANQAYMESRYSDAIRGYEKALDEGYRNGHVYYNLGNAYFEEGDLGKAVWNYLKAQKLLPRNEDVKANLKHAWRQTQDKLDWHSPHPASAVLFWLEDVTLEENLKALQWACLLFWSIQGIRSIRREAVWDSIGRVSLLIFITAALSTGARWHFDHNTHYGVVLNAKQDVLSQPNNRDGTLYTLHAGTVLRVKGTHGNWTEIQLIDGRSGWIPNSSIGI